MLRSAPKNAQNPNFRGSMMNTARYLPAPCPPLPGRAGIAGFAGMADDRAVALSR